MKRCPQCEFIYEDDQSLCDMDGILLVFDSQKLPKQNMRKSHWRTRVVPAVAIIVLTTVLSLVYYVSTRHRQTTQVSDPSASVNAAPTSSTDSQPVASDSDSRVITPEPPAVSEPGEMKAPAGREAKKTVKAKSTSNQKPGASNHSPANDSKIESFVKKTGRLLKKPFKF
jgi:hypothetical protein